MTFVLFLIGNYNSLKGKLFVEHITASETFEEQGFLDPQHHF